MYMLQTLQLSLCIIHSQVFVAHLNHKLSSRIFIFIKSASHAKMAYSSADMMEELKSPTDLKVIILSSTSAIMSWRDPMHGIRYADGSTDGSTYTVRYGVRLNSSHVSNYTYLSPPYFPSLYLVDLTPNTEYEFSVRRSRGDRHSAWSVPVYNKTLEAGQCNAWFHWLVGDPINMLDLIWKDFGYGHLWLLWPANSQN